jgi:hypothetical protein
VIAPHAGAEIRFEVTGLPPAKAEAKSMLSPGHSHAGRVRALLEGAAAAVEAQGWAPTTEPVGLSVEIRATPNDGVWDATNYLGGIADVLQDKRRLDMASRAALGDLAEVALYVDDRQIKAIDYRLARGTALSYAVAVRVLAS